MIRSIDHDVSSFLNCLDLSVEASRDIFRQLDAKLTVISDDEWGNIQLKVMKTPVVFPVGHLSIFLHKVTQYLIHLHTTRILLRTHYVYYHYLLL